MTITIEMETDNIFEFDYKKTVEDVIDATMDYCSCPYESEVNVMFVDHQAIHEINLEQRQVDAPTDVLSFPMVDYHEPGDFSHLDDLIEYFHPDTGELMLGDIIICVDKLFEQAREYNHSPKRELAFLTVHSMLHLFGYDHMEEEERVEMETIQASILNQAGYTREV